MSVLVIFLSLFLLGFVQSDPQVPCYFIFGDSLVDNGNNNDIASLARANYPPYGIDFPGGPSGRFCNGLTTVDIIGIYTLTFYFLFQNDVIFTYQTFHFSNEVSILISIIMFLKINQCNRRTINESTRIRYMQLYIYIYAPLN